MRLGSRIQPTLRRAIAQNKDKLQAQHPTLLQPSIVFSKPLHSARPSYSTSTNSPSSHQPPSPPNMDTSEPKMETNTSTQPESQSPATPPSLPALPAAGDGASSTLEVGGAALRMDHLGPLVVNEDGTMSWITNWEKMTDIEQQNTLRILGKRNQMRLAKLRAAQSSSSENERSEKS
ncbi:hypothetical protein F5Y12DRAFT_159764 [Xylaria sp. FL1777]|nr:hypothetical protein F5Y12DRAFT_159764 [Xylaria sp. FL1777]